MPLPMQPRVTAFLNARIRLKPSVILVPIKACRTAVILSLGGSISHGELPGGKAVSKRTRTTLASG